MADDEGRDWCAEKGEVCPPPAREGKVRGGGAARLLTAQNGGKAILGPGVRLSIGPVQTQKH